jgi:hypothetical protein
VPWKEATPGAKEGTLIVTRLAVFVDLLPIEGVEGMAKPRKGVPSRVVAPAERGGG